MKLTVRLRQDTDRRSDSPPVLTHQEQPQVVLRGRDDGSEVDCVHWASFSVVERVASGSRTSE
ncbi:MAG TPA: hypothetical protein VMB05_14380 [Solirubrobacteraceae bacterium]|nr:hypothetical protein [Solirubrobacteraceae bacterium]